MVRAQIQFTEEQYSALKERSAETGRSISDLVREGVGEVLRYKQSRRERMMAVLEIAGKYDSGLTDVSVNHDKYLGEIDW